MERLTPAALGKLVALYEHNVFTQEATRDIDPSTSGGSSSAKQLAQRIIPELEDETGAKPAHQNFDKHFDQQVPQRKDGSH